MIPSLCAQANHRRTFSVSSINPEHPQLSGSSDVLGRIRVFEPLELKQGPQDGERNPELGARCLCSYLSSRSLHFKGAGKILLLGRE